MKLGKIGIFDSGLGGLIIAKSIFSAKGGPDSGGKNLPSYDYIYLGDTARVPYGNRSQSQILNFTKQALRFLFASDCKLVIIACNTSSAKALREIQREFLPKFYPDRKVLGVIVPTVEVVGQSPGPHHRVGIISTPSTAESHAYKRELLKINKSVKVFEQAAPKLVPLIESNQLNKTAAPLKEYLKPLMAKKIDALVLGCTHYPILKKQIKAGVGKRVKVISQDEIIPNKLSNYLKRHKEISAALSKYHRRTFAVTKINAGFKQVAKRLFGKEIKLKLVKY